MPRDFWQTIRPAIKVDRIKKSITLDAAEFDCGFERASVYQRGTVSPLRLASNVTLSNTQVTIDFWAKFLSVPALSTWDVFSMVGSPGAATEIRMTMRPGDFDVKIITSLGTYTLTQEGNYFNEWHRYTITFSVTDNLLLLYIDGVVVNSVSTTGNLTDNDFTVVLGQALFLTQGIGYWNELALYSNRKTAEAIKQIASFKGNIGAYGTGLQGYWKLNNLDAGGISVASVGSIDISGNGGQTLNTEEYASIKFGASFIAARYRLTAAQKISFRFPVVPPNNTTGQLCVSWLDDDGVLQRRKFWTLEGVDIAPNPATYNGEPVGPSFDLEWWNIDGMATIVVPEDLVLRTSKTTAIQTSYDSTAIVEVAATADTTIAEAFSLTLPSTFQSQQTYTP